MADDGLNQKENSDLYGRREKAIRKAEAVRALGSAGIHFFSPFKPKLSAPSPGKVDLQEQLLANNKNFNKLINTIKLASARKETASQISSFNAYAAQRGTIPQTVANLYLSRISEPLAQTRAYIEARTAFDAYQTSMQQLSYTCSALEQTDIAMSEIRRANDRFNHGLLNDVFNLAVDNFFPLK